MAQRTYLRKRDARIEHLFIRDGLEPREIAELMLHEGTLRSASPESAARTVRGVVQKIRARLDSLRDGDSDPKHATNEIDALERKLQRLRADRDWHVAVSLDETTVSHTTITPNGAIVIEKAKWPAGVREKAREKASVLAKEIADLEITLAARRHVDDEAGDGAAQSGLTIIESDKSISDLIAKNLNVN